MNQAMNRAMNLSTKKHVELKPAEEAFLTLSADFSFVNCQMDQFRPLGTGYGPVSYRSISIFNRNRYD